jgi:hypothetical protein
MPPLDGHKQRKGKDGEVLSTIDQGFLGWDMFDSVHWSMLSRAEIARIKADLSILEKAYDSVTDSGIRQVISDWIEEAKKKLAGGMKKDPGTVRC